MAAIMDSPVSPMSAHAYPMHDGTSKLDMTHLSGATMADLIMEPQIRVLSASTSSSKRSSKANSKSKRSSYASTTKSELRHSNQLLIEMLQNIQTELATHRTIMLDIQHRVSHLEHESEANGSVNNDASRTTLRALEGSMAASRRTSKLVPPEGQTWWAACQNFARNCDTPFSANEFLKTPRPYSGIDWQFGLDTKPNTPPMTPPDIDDLPSLTPTSEYGENSDVDTPKRHDIELDEDDMITSTPKIEETESDDIRERTVEFDKRKVPAPPTLQPPPSGKPPSEQGKETKPVVALSADNPQRYFKGVKSLATYKAFLRHKATDKEHQVLIHFHRRGELKADEEA